MSLGGFWPHRGLGPGRGTRSPGSPSQQGRQHRPVPRGVGGDTYTSSHSHTRTPIHSQLHTHLFSHSTTYTHTLSHAPMGHAGFRVGCTISECLSLSYSRTHTPRPHTSPQTQARGLLPGCSIHTRPSSQTCILSLHSRWAPLNTLSMTPTPLHTRASLATLPACCPKILRDCCPVPAEDTARMPT